jgi:hypothetical protein
MSEEDCLRPIRGDVWYFSTKSVASGKGNFVYYCKGNLGFRLVEEIEDPASDVLKYHRLHRGGRWYFLSTIACVAICSYESLGTKYDHIGVRLVELIDD